MCTKESKMNYKFDGSKVYFTSDTHFFYTFASFVLETPAK